MSNEIENIVPLYLSDELKISALETLYRRVINGQRVYIDSDNYVYLSATTFLSAVLPTSKYLTDWKVNHALNGSDWVEELNTRAEYGTAMHVCIELFCRKKRVSLPDIRTHLYDVHKTWAESATQKDWVSLFKDLAAFTQFVHEKNVKIHAIELPIKFRRLGIASSIDIVCTLDFNKTRRPAIIDLKSGKKGFYATHRAQLEIYKQAYNESIYGAVLPVEMIFNWAPNEWRTNPSYKLENQTKNEFVGKLEHLHALALAYDVMPSQAPEMLEFPETFVFGEAPKITFKPLF